MNRGAVSVGLLGFGLVAFATSCFSFGRSAPYRWNLPKGFPEPLVPADNPMTVEKVELGRYLFYDTRLSVNGKQSCASCHKQELAFTDGKPVGKGATGEHHTRGAMSLVNIAYSNALTWSDPTLTRLEDQALVPMFGTHPIELGRRQGDDFLPTIRKDATYRRLFANAFPGLSDPYSIANVTKAIACFERSIISARSPYDRYHYNGDEHAVPDSAKRGEELFFSERLECFHCHGGFNFSDDTTSRLTPLRRPDFHNTGLYNVTGPTSYPAPNVGIFEHTKNPADVGKFKAPTLRNIAVTAPYMHDGSIATLDGVIDHYSAGGRSITSGPNEGMGHLNPNKDGRIAGFDLTPDMRADLLAFLNSLTDTEVLHDPRFSNPWDVKR